MNKLFLTLAIVSGLANAHNYTCKGVEGDDKGSIRELRVTARTLTVKQDSEYGGATWKGRLDSSYKPQGPNKNFVRFQGKYSSGGTGGEYTPWYLVHNDLVDGESKGYLKEQARGEGYFATKFYCRLTE